MGFDTIVINLVDLVNILEHFTYVAPLDRFDFLDHLHHI